MSAFAPEIDAEHSIPITLVLVGWGHDQPKTREVRCPWSVTVRTFLESVGIPPGLCSKVRVRGRYLGARPYRYDEVINNGSGGILPTVMENDRIKSGGTTGTGARSGRSCAWLREVSPRSGWRSACLRKV